MKAFVNARYEYHWAPLVGCLVAHIGQIGAPQPSYIAGSVTGISYQPPQDAALPPHLRSGLSALGVAADVKDSAYPNRLQRLLTRRRIRRELRVDRPVTVYGVGVSPFGPAWGLIVGCDDDRRAWRREGPMTEQVSPWLPESDLDQSSVHMLISAHRSGDPEPEAIERTAAQAMLDSVDRVHRDLVDRIGLLDSNVEIEPQRYSHDVQALAGNWGEAATFWREVPHDVYTPVAQHMAVTLSRYATLFPYPMGGQPNNPGVRSAAVHILREARDAIGAAR